MLKVQMAEEGERPGLAPSPTSHLPGDHLYQGVIEYSAIGLSQVSW